MISTGVLREKLSTAGWADSPFELLAELSSVVFRDPDVGRELTIRALDSRELLADQYRPILDEITANTGLHPYIVENLKGFLGSSSKCNTSLKVECCDGNEIPASEQ